MTLVEALQAAGMTPPAQIVPERWMRFPGCGKGKSNRAGWCRLITPTLATYGDWSTGLSEIWSDDSHRDDAESARLLTEARAREIRFAAEQRMRQTRVADEARALIRDAMISPHPYLARKGFPDREGLVVRGKLLVPVRDSRDYGEVLSVQEIDEHGEKRFLAGGRTRGGVHRIGAPLDVAKRVVLCEGYATGLSLDAALQRLPGPHTVVVCFSAYNLEIVAESVPQSVVCADNDVSKVGELAARRTGLFWVMPPEIGDFNDLHQRQGLLAVVEALRPMF
jgi:putative DNA primase/helicase